MKLFNSELKSTDHLTEGVGGGSPDDILRRLKTGLSDTFDREMVSAGAQSRKLGMPGTETAAGTARGRWKGSSFVLDDSYVPEKYNDAKCTMAQIKKNLSDTFGIQVDSIPYNNGVADFSSISVAHIPTSDIVKKATGMGEAEYKGLSQIDRTHLFQDVFSDAADGVSKREKNFSYADQLAAERQIEIPGLKSGYSADDLKKWRADNKFSWDEQVNAGYNLVPTIIHGNLSHTGLVSTSGSAYSYLKQRQADMTSNPERYCWDEGSAPISIQELEKLNSRKKGEKNMAMRRVLSRGMNLGRHEISGGELGGETGENIGSADSIITGLGKKFESDKGKLENAIERVEASNIKSEDKEKMIAELNAAIDALQSQYENEVSEAVAKYQEEIEGQIGEMSQSIEDISGQATELRAITMEAAAVDASAAADAAEEKKQEFEQMKTDSMEQLRQLREKADAQKQRILGS